MKPKRPQAPIDLGAMAQRLDLSPSAIKKRVARLDIPVARGSRGKFTFSPEAIQMMDRADAMLRAGLGFDEVRQALGLPALSGASIPLQMPEMPHSMQAANPAEGSAPPQPASMPANPSAGEALPSPVVALAQPPQAHPPEATAPPSRPPAEGQRVSPPAWPQASEGPKPLAISMRPTPPKAMVMATQESPQQAIVELEPEHPKELPQKPEPSSSQPSAQAIVMRLPRRRATPLSAPAQDTSNNSAEPKEIEEAPKPFPEEVGPSWEERAVQAVSELEAKAGIIASMSVPLALGEHTALPKLEGGQVEGLEREGPSAHQAPKEAPDERSWALAADARMAEALALLAARDRQLESTQGKLENTLSELAQVTATAAAFQERSANLAHELLRLRERVKLLEAPKKASAPKGFWARFWGS